MHRIDFFGQNDMFAANRQEYLQIVDSVLSNEALLRGQSITHLEEKVAKLCKRKFSICVNSGTDALFIALKSLGVQPGDEIILPAFSFVASATPVLMLGAKPIFIDISPDTCMIQMDKIEQAITAKTKGIIVVDIFGECLDYMNIKKICSKHNIFYLEDGAQAFMSFFSATPAGSFGDISTFSFDVSKTVYGLSTGGMILTDSQDLYEKAVLLRGHGFLPAQRDFVHLGINSQMSTVNAALISYRIDKEPEYITRRQQIREIYDNALADTPNIRLLKRHPNSVGNNHKYIIMVEKDKRQDLIDFLATKNIPTKIHYNKALPEYHILKNPLIHDNVFIQATKVSRSILSLPIHAFLSDEDVTYICNCIQGFFSHEQ